MYGDLERALLDLEKEGMLKRIHKEVSPYLEMAEIAKQTFKANGPALLFEHVKGSPFRAACNIFGTQERINFLFRKSMQNTQSAILFKSNPMKFFEHPNIYNLFSAFKAGLCSLPKKHGHIKNFTECKLSDLPQIQCWPRDGGAFITLPQVCTLPNKNANAISANIGMYRIQISGNSYEQNKECGLHYQINRDIAKHHQKAIEQGYPLKVSIFIGGPLAHTIAAIMPMPENLSELLFAGMLSKKRFRYFMHNGYLISSDADFCILGELANDLKPEGPFGDHLGYYSETHEFPYIKIYKVLCKKNAIFPFTVVGRPPQEDTLFGNFVHNITKPMVPASVPGLCALHAVDAAGVHPLCLATAHECYRPYAKNLEPMEILKTANAILGFNQASLSKYLFIAAVEDSKNLDVYNVVDFFSHVLSRINLKRDLHFQTCTTVDTLDYTGTKLNHGSKLVIAAAGKPCRTLRNNPDDLNSLNIKSVKKITMPGVITLQACAYEPSQKFIYDLKEALLTWKYSNNYPLISVTDICELDPTNLDDFLWATFTRSDPATDIYGLNEQIINKHWSIDSPIIIDARIKPQHTKALDVPENVKIKAYEILKSENILKV